MPSTVSPPWQEKATGFFSSSGMKLRRAGSFMGDIAKDAKVNVSDATERVGTMFRSQWTHLQQPSTRHAVQESLIVAAASTSNILRKGVEETKEKVTVGKLKMEEVARKTAQKSRVILTDIERWQKGVVASSDAFGVPIEVTVQRQQSARPVPHILIKSADYIVLEGLNSENLFKCEGDQKTVQNLVMMYNQDPQASLPEGVDPTAVATLVKCYLASLPEPLTTFKLYDEIRSSRSSIHVMRTTLKKLPNVNYMTLEFVTALLLRVCQKSSLNKMNSRSVSQEMAPVIMWQRGWRPAAYMKYWSNSSPSTKHMHPSPASIDIDLLADGQEEEEGEASSTTPIPLDDGVVVDLGAMEVVQCLIEHHNTIFSHANETIW